MSAKVRWRTRNDGSFGPPRHWYAITVYDATPGYALCAPCAAAGGNV